MIRFGVGKITVRCYLIKTAIIQLFYDFSRYFSLTRLCRKDTDQYVNELGALVPNSSAINRARLKVDTRKWLASKLVPKVYGNKVDIEGDNSMSEELRQLSADLEAKYARDY